MASTDPATPAPEQQKKRRRWPKVLLVLFLLFLAALAFLNWFGASMIVEKVAIDQLSKQFGADGTLDVSGSLTSGLQLKNADFSGTEGIQKLKFSEVSIGYSVPDLLKKKIDLVRAKDLELVLDIAKMPKSEPKEEEPPQKSINQTLRDIQALYAPIRIDISNIDATILQDGKLLAKVDLAELQHYEDSADTEIQGLQVRTEAIEPARETPVQDVTLTWSQDQLAVDSLMLLPEVGLRNVQVGFVEENALDLGGNVLLPGGTLGLSSPTRTSAKVNLIEGAIDLPKVLEIAGQDLPLGGRITQLDADFSNLDKPVHDITGAATVGITDFYYSFAKLKDFSVNLILENREVRLASRATPEQPQGASTVELDAIVSIDGFETFGDLKSLDGKEVSASLTAPEIQPLITMGVAFGGQGADPSTFPDGRLELDAVASLVFQQEEKGIQGVTAQLDFSDGQFKGEQLPALHGAMFFAEQKIDAALTAECNNDALDILGFYDLTEKLYTFQTAGLLPTAEIVTNAIAKSGFTLPNSVALAAEGSGNLEEKLHNVELFIPPTQLVDKNGVISILGTHVEASWPNSVEIDYLTLKNPRGAVQVAADWDGSTVQIDRLQIADAQAPLISISGKVPFDGEKTSLEEILSSEDQIDLTLTADQFRLQRIKDIVATPALDGITGSLDGELRVTNTIANPNIDGSIRGENWEISKVKDLQPLDFVVNMETRNGELQVNGNVDEAGAGLATFEGKLPITVGDWVNDPESIKQTPLNFSVNADDLEIERFKPFVGDSIERMEGSVDVGLKVTGTIGQPEMNGSTKLTARRISFENENIPELRDSDLNITYSGDTVNIAPSTFQGNGGEFTVQGAVRLGEGGPFFDVNLNATRALLYRDDNMSLRANVRLNLDGPMSGANLSGGIAMAESIYFKDIEIVPFGVPAKSVPTPRVPRVDGGGGATSGNLPIPEPFGSWTVSVDFSTPDPILIRGNLAQGEIVGTGVIRGTLKRPLITLNGEVDNGNVELPLSQMEIVNGDFRINPGEGFIPQLNIRGQSKIGNYRIFLYVYGKATSPQLVFTSNPPLPESEILTLLATGTTSSDLEDGQVASMKAFQLLVNEFRRKYMASRGNEEGPLTPVFDALDNVDLKSGQNDPFSGRRFNSATLQLTDRVFVQAAFDKEGNSRGIVIYSLRF